MALTATLAWLCAGWVGSLPAAPALAAPNHPHVSPSRLVLTASDLGGQYRATSSGPSSEPKKMRLHGLLKAYERDFSAKKHSNPIQNLDSRVDSFRSTADAQWALRQTPKELDQESGGRVKHVKLKRYGDESAAFAFRIGAGSSSSEVLFVVIRVSAFDGTVFAGGLSKTFRRKDLYPILAKAVSGLRRGHTRRHSSPA